MIYRQHFDNVTCYVVQCMSAKDTLFAKLFQMLQIAGSYADDIKVSAPDEFDVLVLLKFPKPIPRASSPGYITINISEGMNTWMNWLKGDIEKYKRFIDNDGYLIQDQILDWLRTLVREILSEHRNSFKINGSEYNVHQQNSGPAVTLNVRVMKGSSQQGQFSIDLVPALQFQSSQAWVADCPPSLPLRHDRFWNAIPKPNKRCQTTVEYWDGSLALLFMEMFDVILEHFKTKTLWSLWHGQYNLLNQLNDNQSLNIYHNLKKIKETIQRSLSINKPDIIYEAILTCSEITAMEVQELQEPQSWCTIS
ncbi:Cyclic GMP-AMP synthase-like receptor 1 [Pseudolycoriella hygida]|uniref:Cyclic GMP-AMP synthase-like receptor 1 n=1 Tax=Pseudolycoriella hygida TaxID=35572 RepID=A0A9Q0N216_9DIPT|nr:Cyclic GMP-AMP synthase-like receptor 1 [Pseudolycoriella hygida]